MKLTKREKLVFYLTIFLIFAFFLERFIFRPLADKLSQLDKEIEVQKLKLIKAKAVTQDKDQLLKEYKDFEVYLKIKGSDEEIMSELLKEIEKLAREATISLSDIKPRSTQKRGNFKEYTIEVRTEARMSELVDFLYHLDNSVLLLRVEKLSLALKEETSDILKASFLITGISLL